MLVIVCGLPGTGKSITANQIANDIDATVLRTDSIRKDAFKQGTVEEALKSSNPFQLDLESIFDREKSIPEKMQRLIWKQKELVYDKLLKQVSEVLAKNLNIVLDVTAYKKDARKRIYEIVKKASTKVFLVECVCEEETLKKRFEKRARKPDVFSYVDKMEIYNILKSKFEDPREDGKPILIYDTGIQKFEVKNFSDEDEEELEKLKDSLEKLRLRFG
jgi:predicted kinase